ncbi:MAG: CRISPR-associated helicase Cas3' [Chloroflexi bacterium]|nr:CRISPR-associated helicase Cas3' [Chloroflexota bacterium]
MPKIDQATYEDRKMRVFLTLRRYPNGLTEADLEQDTGLNRRTLNNYLRALETEGKIYKDGLTWAALPFDELRLRQFELSPEEAMTLYLATRLLAKQHDKRNEPAETALMKLAAALKTNKIAGDEIHQAAQELAQRPQQGEYDLVFRAVMQAYIYRRMLRITYEPLNRKAFETDFSPYLIEPSAIGFTTYAIGHSSIVNATRTYKLERIKAAALTRQEYVIPREFRGLDVLKSAWSVIYGENLLTVVLRFSPNVRKRVEETRWHFSEAKRDDPAKPGYLLWQAQVADTTDMLPWVRGWGADCEVVEPRELRNALTREARELAEMYKVMEAGKNQIQYYAHSKKGKDKSEWQPLIAHLTNSANLAEKFGADAGISELARTAALIHDLGKYSKAFQARLDGSPRKVDHATAGAREATSLFNQNQNQRWLATMLAYCVAGHHTGLPDFGSAIDVETDATLSTRLDPNKKTLEDFSAYKTELDLATLTLPPNLKIRPDKERPGFSLAFFTRMLYSTLVDADFQETETYMNDGEKPRGEYPSIEELCQKFNTHLRKFDNPEGDINRKRTETLKTCIAKADSEQGFFTLTVPTGGGKTLASMAFALNHAVKHGLKRIIYVIPFTTIIEQNAGVFKECLGEQNVLEHHSNFDWNPMREASPESADNETNDVLSKLKLASENWDIPIVVTTNVQFFESLFANKSSRCRKLHNLAKSVIIFDEAQMLPREYLDPCMLAVKELVQNYGASTVFCTATQPALDKRLPGVKFIDLVPDSQALFDFYKRVQIKNLGKVPDAELIEKMNAHPQVLCIVNTRRHAKGLFDGLTGEGSFHLSTLMCPAHRKEKLLEIRKRLKTAQACRVISTQVMEAGIDVDFPVGFRALAGLDSIVQAAGRVNRNKNNPMGDVFVFAPETPFIKKTPAFIKQGASVAESILRDYADNPDSIQAINAYFSMLYNLQDSGAFDAKKILSFFDKQTGELDFDFKTAAENFRLIENNQVAVVIPYKDEAREILEQARYHPYPFKFARQLQTYTVNIYQNEFEKLQSKGVIETCNETYQVLTVAGMKEFYNENTGLVLPADVGGEAVFFD